MEQEKPKVTALVPMRHHSQRVPEKNFRPLAGRPLYHHILNTLEKCKGIDHIVVDTDSPVIMNGIMEYFPDVQIIMRPDHLRADQVPMNEILMFDTMQVESDFYLQTHSTNPLLSTETIDEAVRTFLANYPAFDSLFSVTPVKTRYWDQLGRPINHNPQILLQTQDLPPIFEENSCMYIFSRDILESRRNRLGQRPMMFKMNADEAWDIDEELDFTIVDILMKQKLEE